MRKLAAILAADIVGYSRLAGADEERTLARLRTLWSDLIAPTISVHHGRVVKRTGDGVLVEFRSVVDAVRCALEVQAEMAGRNAEVPPERRIDFRVGIHLGDVVEESDGDLMGDGVNLAARLEGIAESGGICLSEDAYRQVRGKIDIDLVDLGERELKNIAQPVHVFAVTTNHSGNGGRAVQTRAGSAAKGGIKAAPSRRSAQYRVLAAGILLLLGAGSVLGWREIHRPRRAPPQSLVVLPFENLNHDPQLDYLADVFTDGLTTQFSLVSGTFVIARNTAVFYKGKAIDAPELGRELGIRYVIEGSVYRQEENLRVNVQVVDAESGSNVAAETVQGSMTRLADLQSEIVGQISNSVFYTMTRNDARKSREAADNADAVDLAMRAQALFQASIPTKEKYLDALRLYDQALAIDPDLLSALNGRALIAIWGRNFFGGNEWPSLSEAEALIDRVLEKNPDDMTALLDQAALYSSRGDAARSEAVCRHMIDINPNYAQAYAGLGWARVIAGHSQDTEALEETAIRHSPHDVFVYVWYDIDGFAQLLLGNDREAVGKLEQAVAINGKYLPALVHLTAAYALGGQLDKATATRERVLAIFPTATIALVQSLNSVQTNPTYLKQSERFWDGLKLAGLP